MSDVLKSINQGLNVARGVHGIRQLRDDWKRRKDTDAALGILQKGGKDFGELNPGAIHAAQGLYQKQKDSELAYQRNMTRKQLEDMTNEWNNAAKILATGGKSLPTITNAYTALNDGRTIEWEEGPNGKLTMRQMMKGEDDQWVPTGNNSTYENLDAAWDYAKGMTANAQTMNKKFLKQFDTDESIREKEETGATGLTREKVNTEKAYQNRLNADTRRLGLLAEAKETKTLTNEMKHLQDYGVDPTDSELMYTLRGMLPNDIRYDHSSGSYVRINTNEKGEITGRTEVDVSQYIRGSQEILHGARTLQKANGGSLAENMQRYHEERIKEAEKTRQQQEELSRRQEMERQQRITEAQAEREKDRKDFLKNWKGGVR